MSAFSRVQQWTTFVRAWHMFDATWQDPMIFSRDIAKVLAGKHKPIWHPDNDCGDHVVIINAAQIALFDDNWRYMRYHYHTGFPRSHQLFPYYHVHEKDPCLLTERYVHKALAPQKHNRWERRIREARLHIYPDDKVPEEILKNISHQIRQHRVVPRRLEDIPLEEIEAFPKVVNLPAEHVEYNEAAFDRPFVDPSLKIPKPKGKN